MSLVLILGSLDSVFHSCNWCPSSLFHYYWSDNLSWFAGQDIAIAGETIVQRLYDGFCCLRFHYSSFLQI